MFNYNPLLTGIAIGALGISILYQAQRSDNSLFTVVLIILFVFNILIAAVNEYKKNE